MKAFSILISFIVILTLNPAWSADENVLSEVNCVSASDKRKLVLVKEEEGCRVDYAKGSETQKLGNQKSGKDFCEKLVDRVKVKLSQAGFDCK